MAAFHSAVNRIPVPRESAMRLAKEPQSPIGGLVDDRTANVGHDRMVHDRWSGTIDAMMTVKTPLVYGEQVHPGDNHTPTEVSIPLDGDGNPVMAPTTIKGMLSRAYETLTVSRFRVFGDHSEQLTYRSAPAEALELIPMRVTGRRDDGGFDAELLMGDSKAEYKDGHRFTTVPAAALQDEDNGHANLVTGIAWTTVRNSWAPHGAPVSCKLVKCLHGDRGHGARYSYWQVTHIAPVGKPLIHVLNTRPDVTVVGEPIVVDGYVYRTAPDGASASSVFRPQGSRKSRRSRHQSKHDERVFFVGPGETAPRVRITPDVAERYRITATSYLAQRLAAVGHGTGHADNRVTAEARAAHPDGHPGLAVGTLAYAVVARAVGGGISAVQEVVPTMVGRRSYETSPRDLARVQKVLPLTHPSEASAADRLFGYAIDDDKAAHGLGLGQTLRGRVTIDSVDTSDAVVAKGKKLLAPLLSPKPSSARRFLTDKDGTTPTRNGGLLSRREYFTDGQFLGAAAYPVHRALLNRGAGIPRSATTVHQDPGDPEVPEWVRLRVRSWIAPRSVIKFRIRVENVSWTELNALLWILDPRNLVPWAKRDGEADPAGFLRLGVGKPLGLGAVQVEVEENGVRILEGEELAEGYRDLTQCLGLEPVMGVSGFKESDLKFLDRQSWVQAMQRAAYGYTDDVEVRYMRLQENKRNNEINNKTRRPAQGKGQSPSDLIAEHPSPLDV